MPKKAIELIIDKKNITSDSCFPTIIESQYQTNKIKLEADPEQNIKHLKKTGTDKRVDIK